MCHRYDSLLFAHLFVVYFDFEEFKFYKLLRVGPLLLLTWAFITFLRRGACLITTVISIICIAPIGLVIVILVSHLNMSVSLLSSFIYLLWILNVFINIIFRYMDLTVIVIRIVSLWAISILTRLVHPFCTSCLLLCILFMLLLLCGRGFDDAWVLTLKVIIPPPSILLLYTTAWLGHRGWWRICCEWEGLRVLVAGCRALGVVEVELTLPLHRKSLRKMWSRRIVPRIITWLRLIRVEVAEVFLHESFFEVAVVAASVILSINFAKLLLILLLIG